MRQKSEITIGIGAALIGYIAYNALKKTSTLPSYSDRLRLYFNSTILRSTNLITEEELQTQFMNLIATMGSQSLDPESNANGIAHFTLPNLQEVYVISNRSAIDKLYASSNDNKYSQTKLFNRLSVILGPDNLMSSHINAKHYTEIRKTIFNRNEAFRPLIPGLVDKFFAEYAAQQEHTPLPLMTVMDKLSRTILIATYFGEAMIKPFEALYDHEMTRALIDSLFSLEPIKTSDKEHLLTLRDNIFTMACNLFLATPERKQLIFSEHSWLHYLLQVRILKNTQLKVYLAGADLLNENLIDTPEQSRQLVQYALDNPSSQLTSVVKDVMNESLFIPLLGYDATATALITTLKIATQDTRILSMLMEEAKQKRSPLHLFWRENNDSLSYAEAVVLEALRLVPPAPVIPEIINERIELEVNGTHYQLEPGTLIFIPLQSVQTHTTQFADIALSESGQKAVGKTVIRSEDIFPERWSPKDMNGAVYNHNYYKEDLEKSQPANITQPGGLLTFKYGPRRCPGMRIALTEILAMLNCLLDKYKINLTDEDELNLKFNYSKALQRHGGNGLFKISPIETKGGVSQVSTRESETKLTDSSIPSSTYK